MLLGLHGAFRRCQWVLLGVRASESEPVVVRSRSVGLCGSQIIFSRGSLWVPLGLHGSLRVSLWVPLGVSGFPWDLVVVRRSLFASVGPRVSVVWLCVGPSGSPWVSSWLSVGASWVCRGLRLTASLYVHLCGPLWVSAGLPCRGRLGP